MGQTTAAAVIPRFNRKELLRLFYRTVVSLLEVRHRGYNRKYWPLTIPEIVSNEIGQAMRQSSELR